MSAAASELRRIADSLDEQIKHEDEERDYWKGGYFDGGRPHRWDMHYWRAEGLRDARKKLRQRAAYLDRTEADR